MKRNYNKRLKRAVFKNLLYILRMKIKLEKITKKDIMSLDERYKIAIKAIDRFFRYTNTTVVPYGLENVPADIKGGVFMSNHQGSADCITIFKSLENLVCAPLMAGDKEKDFYMGTIINFMKGEFIDLTNLRSQSKTYQRMADNIETGVRYIIFPEAGFADNKNDLQEFHSPCFQPAIKTRCPIIPVCLYDTYRVFKDPSLEHLFVECHFLEPIYYEKYQDLSRKELAQLVQERIQKKMDEIKAIKNA